YESVPPSQQDRTQAPEEDEQDGDRDRDRDGQSRRGPIGDTIDTVTDIIGGLTDPLDPSR
ncbi:hypothetical protein ACFQ07_21875, partial [Actinomadura adrarensis]